MSDPTAAVRKGGRILLAVAVVAGVVLIFGRGLAGFFTEVLWYRSVGFSSVFWTRMLVEGGTKVLAGAATALAAFLNFRVVARSLVGMQIRRQFGNLVIAERIPKRLITWGVLGISLLLGFWLGAAFPQGAGLWLLLLLRAPDWGVEVPHLGHDVSFYVFALPILGGFLVFGLAVLFLLLSFSAAGYAATGSLSLRGGRPSVAPHAAKQLSVLGGIFLLFLAGNFFLKPFELALDGNSGVQGIFGFADATARVMGYRALGLITLLAGVAVAWAGFRKRAGSAIGASIAVVVAGLILVQGYPQVVQRFQVEPNELDREGPYIESNIRFTRLGFGLDGLQEQEYDYSAEAQPDWAEAARQFAGLPIWTPGALLTTFQEVDAQYRYYDFEEVTVDRYGAADGGVIPVAVSVREIDRGGIPDQNWQNLHLRTLYQTGMGAVASEVTRRTPEGRPPMLLSGIPPVVSQDPATPPGLALDEPSVYFGSRDQLYSVVDPDSVIAGGGDLSDLPRGIAISGIFRKLALAWRFGDANLLFASEVSGESQFVFRRMVTERAMAIAPFLRFPESPYPVIHDGRIVWILEGFTATARFPLGAKQDLAGGGTASYVRNSVKVTVDAVTGETRFYRMNVDDPLLEAWSRVFPDVLTPVDEMPDGLQEHIRYPRSLLEAQARILLQYHQETAPVFHGQQDVWALPQELAQGTRPVGYVPEYGLYRLPGEAEPEFLLTTVFVPTGRQNLTAVLVARCDPDRFGELLLYDIEVDERVPGPRQIEALVEQDPVISQQFSLWRQGGSQVWSGHLHVVPVGETLFYLEPIFLAAEADAIPELRRFVVSDGRRVAMEPTLEEALASLSMASGGDAYAPPAQPGPGVEASAGGSWPREALDLLDQAEASLREGDWAAFGAALAELRALLANLSQGAPGG